MESVMNNNLAVLQQAKVAIAKQNNSKFISQEEMVKLVAIDAGMSCGDIYRAFHSFQNVMVDRFNNDQDALLPGIMRIIPGEGGLTRRYIAIQSVSETLKRRLK